MGLSVLWVVAQCPVASLGQRLSSLSVYEGTEDPGAAAAAAPVCHFTL